MHKWNKWGEVLDTGNHVYKAQFKECKRCGKVKRRFIALWTSSACHVRANEINASLSPKSITLGNE